MRNFNRNFRKGKTPRQHLIAAAPELLEATKNIYWLVSELQMFTNRPEYMQAIEQCHAAIAKAEAK